MRNIFFAVIILLIGMVSCQYPEDVIRIVPDVEVPDSDTDSVPPVNYELDTTHLNVSQTANVLDMASCRLSGVMNSKMLTEFDAVGKGFLYRKRNDADDRHIVSYCKKSGTNIDCTIENLEQGTQYEYCMFLETRKGAFVVGDEAVFETYPLDLYLDPKVSVYESGISIYGTFHSKALAGEDFEMYVVISEDKGLLDNKYYSKTSPCTVFSPGEFTADFYGTKSNTTYYAKAYCVYKSSTYVSDVITFTLN